MSSVSYKGFSFWNHITNVKLRSWNRCATFWNISKMHDIDTAKAYISRLDDISKQQVKNLFNEIRERGYESVRREVVSNSQSN